MHRIYDFFRGHPLGVDSFWALLLLAAGCGPFLADLRTGTVEAHVREHAAGLPVVLAFGCVVALRRVAPEKMLVLAVAAGVAQLIAGVRPGVADLALLLIFFTVASRHTVWASRVALGGAVVAPAAAALRWPSPGQSTAGAVLGWIFLTVTFVLAWVLGDSRRTRRAYYAQLEERATRLEREREAHAEIAAAAERARIARELHDVVAHNVSAMVVQADGAAYVLDTAPDRAREALHTISGTGRQALGEMRRLLGVLERSARRERDGRGRREDADAYVPQPGVEQLAELVEQWRTSGFPVEFGIEGTPRPMAGSVELTAYRIVQEALTNSRAHGGPDVGATVRLRYGDGRLSLLVEDDGRGTVRELYERGGRDGLGHGLIGMRERVGMVGGSLEIGPRAGGGFRIRALLPLKSAE